MYVRTYVSVNIFICKDQRCIRQTPKPPEMPEHRPTNAQAGLYKTANQFSTLFRKRLEFSQSFKTDKQRNELPKMRRWRSLLGIKWV